MRSNEPMYSVYAMCDGRKRRFMCGARTEYGRKDAERVHRFWSKRGWNVFIEPVEG